MKKTILTTLLVTGISLGAFAQGTILLNNVANTGVYNGFGGTAYNGGNGGTTYSASVTTNGLIFTTDVSAQAGNALSPSSTLIGVDFSWALYGGSTAGTATTLISSETGSAISSPSDDNGNYGNLTGQSGAFNVSGSSANAIVYLDLYIWEGSTFSTYALAQAGNDYTGTSGVFMNPSGGGANPASSLTGMPDVLLTVPEPTTLAFAGLGGLSMLLMRRRNS